MTETLVDPGRKRTQEEEEVPELLFSVLELSWVEEGGRGRVVLYLRSEAENTRIVPLPHPVAMRSSETEILR